MTTQEIVQETIRRVSNPDTRVSFTDWRGCTCGQLYLTAVGKAAPDQDYVHSPEGDWAYARVLVDVATALDAHPEFGVWSPMLAAKWLSDQTARRFRAPLRTMEVERQAILSLLRDALAAMEDVHAPKPLAA